MRIIIAGGRDFSDRDFLCRSLNAIYKRQIEARGVKNVEVIVGKAKGADTLGEDWASQRGFTVTPFPADWKLHGKSAGMIRNREMAAYAAKSPDKMKLLVAFWNGSSAGTANMIQTATQFQIPVMIVPYKQS